MTLPGFDVATAEGLLAAWGDFTRFPDADHAASYVGLVPCTKQSAEHCYHGPITKRGNSHARWMLIEAAQHLDKHPGPLGHFFRRLMKKKGRNVAVVAAARKLAMIAWTMLMRNEPYRYAIPRSTETKLAKLRVKATGQRRKSGTPKGAKRQALLPGGGRTHQVLGRDLPERGPAATAGACRRRAADDRGGRLRELSSPRWRPRRLCRELLTAEQTVTPPPALPSNAAARVRVPLLCCRRTVMPGIDFRALRREVGMEAVLKLLGFVPVQRRGGQVRGACPLHTPKHDGYPLAGRRSFSANIERNAYRCFQCGSVGKPA